MCRAIYRPCTALAARKMQAEPCAPNTSPICTICGQLGWGTGRGRAHRAARAWEGRWPNPGSAQHAATALHGHTVVPEKTREAPTVPTPLARCNGWASSPPPRRTARKCARVRRATVAHATGHDFMCTPGPDRDPHADFEEDIPCGPERAEAIFHFAYSRTTMRVLRLTL